MKRKGQAAMEFLMTYGWAILAAIVVIAVLAIYFRPSTLVSSSTFVTAPFFAQGQTINTTGIALEVKNNGGESLTVDTFSLSITTPSGGSCTGSSPASALAAGASLIMHTASDTDCTGLTAGNTFNADVTIEYTKSGSSLTQKATGTMAGSVSA
tara:strand:+ start:756 stop:1217 length:462 start_codon:yes stop_codon:yes gene_type:complete